MESLFDEGFNSGDEHDLDAWEAKAKEVLNETDRQSLAAVKAEALREAATAFETLGPDPFGEYLRERADRIEREAKENES